MNQINDALVTHVRDRLFSVSGSLRGIGSLFKSLNSHSCLSDEELFCNGQLFETLARELIVLEDLLACGRDSQYEEMLKTFNKK